MLEEGIKVNDRYLLLKRIGKGGFSEVWLAKDEQTSISVALKFYAPGVGLDDDGIEVFKREFTLLANLNHTNLLRPSYYDHYEKMPYLVLTYCENGSSLSLINQIEEERAWLFLRDVSDGLHYLHTNTPPIIHQDIKPDNILIDSNGRFLITDFGISTRIRSTLRKSVAVMPTSGGTLAYMAPERFGEEPTPIKASDIYSLGATMFELLTGEPPFGDHGGLLQRNGAAIPRINKECSAQLKELVYRCLAKDPWDRPTALEINNDARLAIEGKLDQIKIKTTKKKGAKKKSTKNLLPVLIVGALSVILITLVIFVILNIKGGGNGLGLGSKSKVEEPVTSEPEKDNLTQQQAAEEEKAMQQAAEEEAARQQIAAEEAAKQKAAEDAVKQKVTAEEIAKQKAEEERRRQVLAQKVAEFESYIEEGDRLIRVAKPRIENEEWDYRKNYINALNTYKDALEYANKNHLTDLKNKASNKIRDVKKLMSDLCIVLGRKTDGAPDEVKHIFEEMINDLNYYIKVE